MGSEFFDNVKPANFWHHKVKNDEAWIAIHCKIDSCLSTVCLEYFKACIFQDGAHIFNGLFIIVNDQYFHQFAFSLLGGNGGIYGIDEFYPIDGVNLIFGCAHAETKV